MGRGHHEAVAVVTILIMRCRIRVGCRIIGAVDHESDVVTASRLEAIVRVVSRVQVSERKIVGLDGAVDQGRYVLKDERNRKLACHLWLVDIRREEAPLGNLGWMRHLVLRDVGERDVPVGSDIRDWCLLVGGIIEVGTLDCNVHRRRVRLEVAGSTWRRHLCRLDLKLVDLRIIRTAMEIWIHVRTRSVAEGRLSRRSRRSMRVTLSERMALLWDRSSFELIGWHMSLTAIVVRACIRTVVIGTGVRSSSKGRLIRVVDLTASEFLGVRVVARRR